MAARKSNAKTADAEATALLDRPCIRVGVAAARDESDPHAILLYDELRITRSVVRITPREFTWLQWFDGSHSLGDVYRAVPAAEQADARSALIGLADRLNEALFLDSPRFREVLFGPTREPSCIGCYPAAPTAIRKQLAGYLDMANGSESARPRQPKKQRLRALLAPHIDYARGNVAYGCAYRDLPALTDAALFVIVGTSHYSAERFTMTRQNFRTPLGIAPVDQTFVDRVVEHYGDGLFDDPLAHIPEHSIELEVLWLQFLLENQRPFRIVPIVVGSLHDCIELGQDPAAMPDLARMVEALRRAEAAAGEPVCYIISGDLAHIGPKFGDPEPLRDAELTRSRDCDQSILKHLERADHGGYFRFVAGERDARRICGLPPTWTVLQTVRPSIGRLLHYGQHVHPRGHESVSFASMAFFA